MIRAVVLLIFLSPAGLGEARGSFLIVWNIGQGAFSTLVKNDECWHFDAGGERYPRKIQELCSAKKNRIFLSHDDWDHMSFVSRLGRFPQTCLDEPPRIFSSARKQEMIERLAHCPPEAGPKELRWSPHGRTTNDQSRVYFEPLSGGLFPGDSTAKEEPSWGALLKRQSVRWWVLGHHGSATSSGADLIARVGHPLAAISSSRWKKYHHPNFRVVARLRSAHIPILKTEDWGNLWIEL